MTLYFKLQQSVWFPIRYSFSSSDVLKDSSVSCCFCYLTHYKNRKSGIMVSLSYVYSFPSSSVAFASQPFLPISELCNKDEAAKMKCPQNPDSDGSIHQPLCIVK
ncbi:hypothetical protein L596_012497 [Steinernema carpocapsae]|uniref:Uncharacterized protein n=1 Tax=Steinernema carpocapsae TaxID=34508 RepID=A0A4U5NX81_STECR|nr:hypothetical protein L596_012497 [Steinernema carpocapsae]